MSDLAETNKLLRRIAFALEAVAATIARVGNVEGETDDKGRDQDVFGTVVEPNGFGQCDDCGCRLVGATYQEDGLCPACGNTLTHAKVDQETP